MNESVTAPGPVGSHTHAFVGPQITDVYEVEVFEIYGTWVQVVEQWLYACPCGATRSVKHEVNQAPHVPDGRKA